MTSDSEPRLRALSFGRPGGEMLPCGHRITKVNIWWAGMPAMGNGLWFCYLHVGDLGSAMELRDRRKICRIVADHIRILGAELPETHLDAATALEAFPRGEGSQRHSIAISLPAATVERIGFPSAHALLALARSETCLSASGTAGDLKPRVDRKTERIPHE